MDLRNYQILTRAANGQFGGPGSRVISIAFVAYNPLTHSVTIRPLDPLNVHRAYQLTVHGQPPSGVADTAGRLLDGQNTGHPGSNFVTQITRKNLVIGGPLAVDDRGLRAPRGRRR